MTLDAKRKGWREATESLEPSQELAAQLQATIDSGPATGPTQKPSTGATSVAVKVVFVVAVVGAIGLAVLRSPYSPWQWRATLGAGSSVDAGTRACPHREVGGYAAP